jgi:hypothetical protein
MQRRLFDSASDFPSRDRGHDQLISNGGRLKPAFANRDKKQPIIYFQGILKNWFKNHLCPS